MNILRRRFLATLGLVTVSGITGGLMSCDNIGQQQSTSSSPSEGSITNNNGMWNKIRSDFKLDPKKIHMAGMLLSTHPRQVQDAINRYRDELNHNPAAYVNESFLPMNGEIREVAAKYMNAKPEEVANTDSTTMGTALVFAGLQIRNDQEIITHEYDYYSTHQSIEYLSSRTGVKVRKIPSYKNIHQVTKEEIVDNLINAIKPETRLVTATWVHSSTGLKVL